MFFFLQEDDRILSKDKCEEQWSWLLVNASWEALLVIFIEQFISRQLPDRGEKAANRKVNDPKRPNRAPLIRCQHSMFLDENRRPSLPADLTERDDESTLSDASGPERSTRTKLAITPGVIYVRLKRMSLFKTGNISENIKYDKI